MKIFVSSKLSLLAYRYISIKKKIFNWKIQKLPNRWRALNLMYIKWPEILIVHLINYVILCAKDTLS